jgi:heavy metal efflux system protein
MFWRRVPLLVLGAIDFGLIVDGSVVMVENILRRLSHRKTHEQPLGIIQRAAQEVARPTFFGVLIIVLVYVPILTLRGVEGKMFRPMALTVLFALAASLVIAIVVMPVLSSYAFRKPVSERETWLMRQASHAYIPVLRRALRFPLVTASIAALVFAASIGVVPFLGAEFIPTLDEGSIVVSIVVMMYRLPGISVGDSLHGNEIIESVLREFPEVQTVYCRTGRPEVATDPMAIDQSDVYVFLKPASQWPQRVQFFGLFGR